MHMHLFAALLATASVTAGPDLSSLPTQQRSIFDAVAADEFCGCDSALTLKGCLMERPSCALAQDASEVLKNLVRTGAPKQAVASFMSQAVMGPYCSLPQEVDISGAPRQGSTQAPVQVIEMADFRCLHCRHAVPVVHQALEALGPQVSLVYMPIVLQPNSPSQLAAEAAMAAHAQGKFWPMHRALFAHEAGEYTPDVVRNIARQVGLNMKRYDKEMAEHTHAPILAAFMERFFKAGLEGTPAFFVNGRRTEMEPTVYPLKARLQMELDRNTGNCK